MGSEELAANLFRITQIEAKLKKDNISNEKEANHTHYNIGKNICEVISKNGETMPEKLPTPKKIFKRIRKRKESTNKNRNKKISLDFFDTRSSNIWYSGNIK